MQETFPALGVSAELTEALRSRGMRRRSRCRRGRPPALAGKDLLAKSPTGPGKTLTFTVPLVERMPLDDAPPPRSSWCRRASSPFR